MNRSPTLVDISTAEAHRRRADELQAQLDEARELLDAIRSGEVDALVVGGDQVYTLKDADRPYRVLIEQMSEGALTLSHEGLILYANRALAQLLGTPPERLVGTSLRRFLAPPAEQWRTFEQLLAGGKGELVMEAADGALVPVLISVSKLPLSDDGEQEVLCAILTDLTDEKRRSAELAGAHARLAAEAARREGEGFARLILESATDYAIIATDLTGRVTTWNTGAEKLFGWSASEITGQSAAMIWTEEDRHNGVPGAEMDQAQRSGRAEDERWHQRRDGSRFWASGLMMPMRRGEDAIGYLKILRDRSRSRAMEAALRESEGQLQRLNETLETRVQQEVTSRGKAEDALRQAQKMEAVGQLTGGVAHDFNNLLTIIKSSTDLLRRPDIAEERRRRYVDAISDTVDRAAKLTGQLLAFARRQALKPEVFDASERLRGVTDMLRTIVGARVEVLTEIVCDPCFVEADISQFETALVNLVVNARDAMDGMGRLTIGVTALSEPPAIQAQAGGTGPFVAVRISDTGSGIPRDKLALIYEPFYTTKEVGKGTGLGLSQVYGFAKQSGGDVAVESEVGRGTTFTLYLPRVEHDPGQAITISEPLPAVENGRGWRVLVVEDNADVGTFSTQLLRDMGYETTWAASGDEALQLLTERAADFDAVFSDVVMPGISGVELGLEIRRLYPNLPVVLTSGYSHVLAEEGRHGFDLVHKPYAVEELSRVLRRVLQHRAQV